MNTRLEQFMAARAAETYPEARDSGHDYITAQMAEVVAKLLREKRAFLGSPLEVMPDKVHPVGIADNKIVGSVVETVSVNVMNGLPPEKQAPYLGLDGETVLKNISRFCSVGMGRGVDVAVSIADNLTAPPLGVISPGSGAAFIGAKPRSLVTGTELDTADGTDEFHDAILDVGSVRSQRILDVGSGQGPALEWFTAHGFDATGITTNGFDWEACRNAGFKCELHDMHELPNFYTGHFDCVWARHVLEHSPIPFFVLHEFARVLKPGGILYAEMPAPDTACAHEWNKNHYSVLTLGMWASLITRAGFEIVETRRICLATPAGPDVYHSLICRKL